MKALRRSLIGLEFICFSFFASMAFAQDVTLPQDFFAQVLDFLQKAGGLSLMLKVSGGILLLIASMKVSFMNKILWSKLGGAQTWVAPILGLIAGVLGLGSAGPVSAASVFVYITAGAGAIMFHELLDTVKAIPGIGPLWVSVISIIEGFLGGGQ